MDQDGGNYRSRAEQAINAHHDDANNRLTTEQGSNIDIHDDNHPVPEHLEEIVRILRMSPAERYRYHCLLITKIGVKVLAVIFLILLVVNLAAGIGPIYTYFTTPDDTVRQWSVPHECRIIDVRLYNGHINDENNVYCAWSQYEYTLSFNQLNLSIIEKDGDDDPSLLPTNENTTAFRSPYMGKPCRSLHRINDTMTCYVQDDRLSLRPFLTPVEELVNRLKVFWGLVFASWTILIIAAGWIFCKNRLM